MDSSNIYFDYNTQNKSFLGLCFYLKSQGIHNNDFHLLLYDKDLIGVDPHDPRLSEEMKRKIIQECKINCFYFFREVVRIPVQGEGLNIGGKMPLNKANLAQLYLYRNAIPFWVQTHRLSFKTMTCHVICVYERLFRGKRYKNVSKDEDTMPMSPDNKCKYIISLLPEYITEYESEKDTEDYIMVYYDDSEFIDNLEGKVDWNNFNMFCSTINDDADKNGSLDFLDKHSVKWNELFYDYLPEVEHDKFVLIRYTYTELGKDEDWYRDMVISLNRDWSAIRREVLLDRLHKK